MTRKEPREKRQQAIINAAISEFIEKGYEGASMQSIAKRAGLTKGGLYHYYSSKEELLIIATARLFAPVRRWLFEAEQRASPVEALRSFIRQVIERWSQRHQLLFMHLSMARIIEGRCREGEGFDGQDVESIRALERLYRRGVELEELRPHDTSGRALALMAALRSLPSYLILRDDLDPEPIILSLQGIFLDELLLN